MIAYPLLSFTAVAMFALVHLSAGRIQRSDEAWHARFLSTGGGVVIAYVFIDLLPKLGRSDGLVSNWIHSFFPYFERHVYLSALAGFILFFLVDRSAKKHTENRMFWFSLISYTLFNFFVGYAVADKNNPEVRPLLLFTFAMGLHYFVNDFHISLQYEERYRVWCRWILVIALFTGWITGFVFALPAAAVALVSAFIGGGVIMNVMRHELPEDKPNSTEAFLLAAVLYTTLLLAIGE